MLVIPTNKNMTTFPAFLWTPTDDDFMRKDEVIQGFKTGYDYNTAAIPKSGTYRGCGSG